MFTGSDVANALRDAQFTHVVWIPDSTLGTWEAAFTSDPALRLVRVSREGEAFGVAAGLMIGGQRPAVILQCTGLFEAGDALRNVVHDLKLPLFMMVGVRGWLAHLKGATNDTCPRFVEPIMQAWQVPYQWLGENATAKDVHAALKTYRQHPQPLALLIAE